MGRFSPDGQVLDWGQEALTLMACVAEPHQRRDSSGLGRDHIFMFNSSGQEREFVIPVFAVGSCWNLFVDTAAESPADIFP